MDNKNPKNIKKDSKISEVKPVINNVPVAGSEDKKPRKKRGANPYFTHVKKYMDENPGVKRADAMKLASSTYTKGKVDK